MKVKLRCTGHYHSGLWQNVTPGSEKWFDAPIAEQIVSDAPKMFEIVAKEKEEEPELQEVKRRGRKPAS
jgi:hypothetical protein